MRAQLEPAFCLRTLPYGDTSLLVEAFTRSYGRVGLVARGTRAAKSRLRGLLQPFQPLLLTFFDSGDLGTLSAAEAASPPWVLDGERVFSGWYLNELLLRLTHRHDPHPPLFEAYAEALAGLMGEVQPVLRIFEKRLLAELGYGLQLEAEWEAQKTYRYDAALGPVEVDPEAPGGMSGASLIALRDERFADEASLRDARRLLRRAIDAQLDGKPLQTPALLRQARALKSLTVLRGPPIL